MLPYIIGAFVVMVIETVLYHFYGEWLYEHAKFTLFIFFSIGFVLALLDWNNKNLALATITCFFYFSILMAIKAFQKLRELI